jgi:hypothetical protein
MAATRKLQGEEVKSLCSSILIHAEHLLIDKKIEKCGKSIVQASDFNVPASVSKLEKHIYLTKKFT